MSDERFLDELGQRAADAVRQRAAERAPLRPMPRRGATRTTGRRWRFAAAAAGAAVAASALVLVSLPTSGRDVLHIDPLPTETAVPATAPESPATATGDPCADDVTSANGQTMETFQLREGKLTAPVGIGDLLVIGTNSGGRCFHAVDAATGSSAWAVPGQVAARQLPVPVQDGVLLPTQGELVFVDARSGDERWRHRAVANDGIAISNSTVVATTGSGGVHAIDIESGEIVWSTPGPLWGPFFLEGDVVHVRRKDGYQARRVDDGEIVRDTPIPGVARAVIAVSGDLYLTERVPNTTGVVDSTTGELLWERNLPGSRNTHPMVVDGRLILAADAGTAYAIDLRSGKIDWSSEIPTPTFTGDRYGDGWDDQPPVVDGNVLIGTRSGIVALDVTTGEEMWRTSEPVATALQVDGAFVYAGTDDGIVTYDSTTGDVIDSWTIDGQPNRTLALSNAGVHARVGDDRVVTVPHEPSTASSRSATP